MTDEAYADLIAATYKEVSKMLSGSDCINDNIEKLYEQLRCDVVDLCLFEKDQELYILNIENTQDDLIGFVSIKNIFLKVDKEDLYQLSINMVMCYKRMLFIIMMKSYKKAVPVT